MGFIWRGWGLFGPVARPTRGAITADCLPVAMAMVSTQGCGAMWRLSHGHVAPPPTVPPGLALQPPRHTCGAQGGGWGCPRGEGGTPRPAGGSPRGAGKDLGCVGQWGRGVVDMRVQGAGCTVQWVYGGWVKTQQAQAEPIAPKQGAGWAWTPGKSQGCGAPRGPGLVWGRHPTYARREPRGGRAGDAAAARHPTGSALVQRAAAGQARGGGGHLLINCELHSRFPGGAEINNGARRCFQAV